MSETEPRVRIGGTATLPAYVASRGGDVSRVLHNAGIVAAELRNPEAWLSLERTAAVFEAAAIELEDPYFGLAFGALLPLQSFGMLSYLVLNAADVEVGLHNLARYSASLSVTGIPAHTVVEDETARLVFPFGATEPDLSRQYVEHITAVLCSMMTKLVDESWTPIEICMEHSPADSSNEVAARLGGPVTYGAEHYAIVFHAECLARPIPGADRSLLPVIERQVSDVVGDAESDPLVASLREELARVLCDGHPDISLIARNLAMSPRTLQRRLQERGLRFKNVVNQTRTALAKEYLAQSGPTVTEIAFLLGYAELSAFDRAFRREAGMSPTMWRHPSNR
jgi:AraC-like DNA-binding protein